MDPPPFVPQGSDYSQGVYGQYPNKVNSPSFVNNYNYCNQQRNNLASYQNSNHSPRTMSEQYPGANFGEDEFEIPPISLSSVATTVGEGSLPPMAEGLQNIGYTRSPEGSARSPAAPGNQGSPQIHGPVSMSPGMRQHTPDLPARQSPAAMAAVAAHPLSGSFSGGPMPTAPQNYDVQEVSSSSNFSDHQVSAQSLTDISNSTHMSLNPQFPPHGLNIPPITHSNWIPGIHNSVATTSQPSYQPAMVYGYPQTMPPDTILTTTYQSAISSVNTMPQMTAGMGTMQPPMAIPGHVRISPPQRESSEDSDDNTPLSQFAAKQHLHPPQRVQPPPPPEVKETKKKPPKRKRKKDPNEPQKPVSAYALFFRDTQAAIKGSNPNASFGEVSKIVASMWDGLEADQKQAYKQKTETAKREYLKKLAAYRASLVSKAAVEIEDVPLKKKGGALTSPMYPMHPVSSPLMPMVPRAIAPKPMGGHPNLQMGPGAMLHTPGMMQPMHPMTQHMTTPANTQPVCTRNGCTRAPISNQQWDSEYCSNECVVDNCRDVFNAWTAANTAQSNLLPTVN